jgi:hypothetical protein
MSLVSEIGDEYLNVAIVGVLISIVMLDAARAEF